MRFSPDFVLFYGTGALTRGAGIAIVPRIPHDSVFSAPRTPNTTRVAYRAKHCETNSRHLRGDYRAGASSDHGPMRARQCDGAEMAGRAVHGTISRSPRPIPLSKAVDPATRRRAQNPAGGRVPHQGNAYQRSRLDGGKTVNAIVREPLRRAGRSSRMPVPARFGHPANRSEAFGDVANAMASVRSSPLSCRYKRLD